MKGADFIANGEDVVGCSTAVVRALATFSAFMAVEVLFFELSTFEGVNEDAVFALNFGPGEVAFAFVLP